MRILVNKNYLQSLKETPGYTEFTADPLPQRRDFLIKVLKEKIASTEDKGHRAYAQIFLNHFNLLKREPLLTQELYLQIFCLAFWQQGSYFDRFISDITGPIPIGSEIAFHNFLVQYEFTQTHINWDKWLSFDGKETTEFFEWEEMKDVEKKWLNLENSLEDALRCFAGTELYASLRKDVISICKQKSKIQSGRLNITENELHRYLFPVYNKSLTYLLNRHKDVTPVDGYREALERVTLGVLAFSRKPLRQKLIIKLWDRNPALDLLQGNFSSCCVAIGEPGVRPAVRLPGVNYRKYPAGILEYLIDKGIQVAEIVDGYSAIGQCWLFVTLDVILNRF